MDGVTGIIIFDKIFTLVTGSEIIAISLIFEFVSDILPKRSSCSMTLRT